MNAGPGPDLSSLAETARRLGASDAAIIETKKILVEDHLAEICKEQCGNYGLSPGCPPHVPGPDGFRNLVKGYDHAVFFRIEVPTSVLVSASEDRRDAFRMLHEVAAGIERAAREMGYPDARAFAGGSCKTIFCHDQPECRVVAENESCLHPEDARHSMSGYGINVGKLMEAAGWNMDEITKGTDPGAVPMGSLSGLVLIG